VDLEYLKIIVKFFEILELGLLDLIFFKNQLFQQDLPKHELWISYGVISNILLSSASKVQMCSFGDEPITPKKKMFQNFCTLEKFPNFTHFHVLCFICYLFGYVYPMLSMCLFHTTKFHACQFFPHDPISSLWEGLTTFKFNFTHVVYFLP
jgi:hypothetical protein